MHIKALLAKAVMAISILFMIASCGRPGLPEATLTSYEIVTHNEISVPDSLNNALFLSSVPSGSCRSLISENRRGLLAEADWCDQSFVWVQRPPLNLFSNPYRLYKTGDTIILNDFTESEFHILGEKGNLVRSFPYYDTPARSVSYADGDPFLYHTDTGINLLRQVNTENGSERVLFSLPQPFQIFSLQVNGGGLVRHGSKLFAMSSLMPYIYVYDEESIEVSYILPEFMERSANTRVLPDMPADGVTQLIEQMSRFQQYYSLHLLENGGDEPLLAVFYFYQEQRFVAVFTTEGETLVNQPVPHFVLGIMDNYFVAYKDRKLVKFSFDR
ncbi:MAG: hypothetical protein LAT67_04430 [Balneolales bacterium]|nr:hypothetical protein [Balneolales bacterium]